MGDEPNRARRIQLAPGRRPLFRTASDLLASVPMRACEGPGEGPVRITMRAVKFRNRLLIAAAVFPLIPGVAWACPACMVGDAKTAGVYPAITLIMSALPLVLVDGLAFWLWRRHS